MAEPPDAAEAPAKGPQPNYGTAHRTPEVQHGERACVCQECCGGWPLIRPLSFDELYGTRRPRRHLEVVR